MTFLVIWSVAVQFFLAATVAIFSQLSVNVSRCSMRLAAREE